MYIQTVEGQKVISIAHPEHRSGELKQFELGLESWSADSGR